MIKNYFDEVIDNVLALGIFFKTKSVECLLPCNIREGFWAKLM